MKKHILLILGVICITSILTGCSEQTSTFVEPEGSTKVEIPINNQEENTNKKLMYEKAAKLYVEILWRDLDENDEDALNTCVPELREKIEENAKIASEARRKSEYYTKEELCEMLNLDENGNEVINFDDMIAPQSAGFLDPTSIDSETSEPESESLVSKDKYEVTRVSKNSGLVTLDNGTQISVPISPEYSGDLNFSVYEDLLDEESQIIYKAEFDGETIYLFVDIDDGQIIRIREKLSV